jgi:hypothetical protein
MFWIEAKSTVVIALFVFSIAYVVAAIVFCLAATLSRRSVAKDLKAYRCPDDGQRAGNLAFSCCFLPGNPPLSC